jgi:hypothetical protein
VKQWMHILTGSRDNWLTVIEEWVWTVRVVGFEYLMKQKEYEVEEEEVKPAEPVAAPAAPAAAASEGWFSRVVRVVAEVAEDAGEAVTSTATTVAKTVTDALD